MFMLVQVALQDLKESNRVEELPNVLWALQTLQVECPKLQDANVQGLKVFTDQQLFLLASGAAERLPLQTEMAWRATAHRGDDLAFLRLVLGVVWIYSFYNCLSQRLLVAANDLAK
ncbi:unnamed protein product [Durusdinium trenchii]|uniref:Uncharacterized protein n=2 Tax=Durusdinium trenchii TaxID=1381693 RepID=A0ABP0NCL5_9DINO|eukprot:g7226.t2